MKQHQIITGILAACLGTSSVHAATLLTTGHADIGLAEGPGLSLHWHDEDNAIEYEPEDAAAFVNPDHAAVTRPSGSQWDFIGTPGGGTYYQLPENQNPNLPFLGIGAEDADSGAFGSWNPNDSRGANSDAVWFGLRLVAVTYGGSAISPVFSLWKDDGFGDPVVWMTSSDGIGSADLAYAIDHEHMNFAFSDPGVYTITFEAFARDTDGTTVLTSSQGDYVFVVPEPASGALLLLAGTMSLARRRRDA